MEESISWSHISSQYGRPALNTSHFLFGSNGHDRIITNVIRLNDLYGEYLLEQITSNKSPNNAKIAQYTGNTNCSLNKVGWASIYILDHLYH